MVVLEGITIAAVSTFIKDNYVTILIGIMVIMFYPQIASILSKLSAIVNAPITIVQAPGNAINWAANKFKKLEVKVRKSSKVNISKSEVVCYSINEEKRNSIVQKINQHINNSTISSKSYEDVNVLGYSSLEFTSVQRENKCRFIYTYPKNHELNVLITWLFQAPPVNKLFASTSSLYVPGQDSWNHSLSERLKIDIQRENIPLNYIFE